MSEPPNQWLSLPEAAAQLGIAETALRSRIKRRTIRVRKDNHGRLLVCLPGPEDRTRTMDRSRTDPGPVQDRSTTPDHPQSSLPDPMPSSAAPSNAIPSQDFLPLSLHRETVERLQASHNAALAAMERQAKDMVSLVQERADEAAVRAERAERLLLRMMVERSRQKWWKLW